MPPLRSTGAPIGDWAEESVATFHAVEAAPQRVTKSGDLRARGSSHHGFYNDCKREQLVHVQAQIRGTRGRPMEDSTQTKQAVARNVLKKSLKVKSGENVAIETWSETLPWANAFVLEARRIGAHPVLLYEDEETYWDSVRRFKPSAVGTVGNHEWKLLDESDAYVFFFGPSDWTRYDGLARGGFDKLIAYNREWYRRAARQKLRGVRMYLGRTSPATADRFGVDLDTWRHELDAASLVDPIEFTRAASRIERRLHQGKELNITHPNGTELNLRLRGYQVQIDDGAVDEYDIRHGNNLAYIPGGVVGVALDERFAEGRIIANRTGYPQTGPLDGGHWTFERGKLSEFEFGKGAAQFEKDFSKAPKGKDSPAFFSIGLNPKLSMSPQMEDQVLGNITVGIGGNAFRGGKNSCPFVSWVALQGATATLDGQPLVSAGKLEV